MATSHAKLLARGEADCSDQQQILTTILNDSVHVFPGNIRVFARVVLWRVGRNWEHFKW